MPSPSVPPLRSVLDIPETEETRCPPKGRASHLPDSTIKQWPKKLGEVIARKNGSSKKNPQLTEGSLRAFNEENEDKRYAYSSPYYRGLTDFSLVISRQKDQINHEQTYAPSIISSTSSKGSFASRVHEWSTSCFSPRGGERRSSSRDKIPPEKFRDTSLASSRSKASVSVTRMDDCIKMDPEVDVIDVKPGAASSESSRTKEKVSIARPGTPFRKADADLVVELDESPITYTTEIKTSAKHVDGTISENVDSEIKDHTIALMNTQKPLGEKESEPLQLVPLSLSLSPVPELAPPNKEPHPLLSPRPLELTPSLTPIQPANILAERVTNKEICKPDNERIFVWADKYRPSNLTDFLCNSSKAAELQDMATKRECNHFIFEGSPGVGKRTMIWALLRARFDPMNLEAQVERKEFHLKGESVGSIYANVKSSLNHVEVNLSELRGYEKHVIVQLINERANNCLPESYDNCRVITLYGADKLSSDAVVYIKWLLERYKGHNKIFFCCSDASKLEPVKPICKLVQLLRPSIQEIVDVLQFIAKEEAITLPQDLAVTIANNSKNNLRQAIRSFEATWHFNSSLKEDQEILTGWEDVIANVAANIIEEQSPRQLFNIRGKLQNLIEHNVSPEFIFTMLVDELKKKVGEELQQQIDKIHRKYNARPEDHCKRDEDPVRQTIHQFMKIEEFIAKFMSWYKSSLLSSLHKGKEVETNDLSFRSTITKDREGI